MRLNLQPKEFFVTGELNCIFNQINIELVHLTLSIRQLSREALGENCSKFNSSLLLVWMKWIN